MTPIPQRYGSRETVTDRVISILIDSTRRQYVLTIVAYITGMLGLGAVFAHELWLSVPDNVAVPAAIVLMGISFLSLFVVTISGPAPGDG